MDIKIGFAHSPRELVVQSAATPEGIEEKFNDESALLELSDERGNRYLVRKAEVAYIEIGAQYARTVGFAGA